MSSWLVHVTGFIRTGLSSLVITSQDFVLKCSAWENFLLGTVEANFVAVSYILGVMFYNGRGRLGNTGCPKKNQNGFLRPLPGGHWSS